MSCCSYVDSGLRPKRARAVSAMDTHALQTALMKGIQDEDEKNDKKIKADRVAGIGSTVYAPSSTLHPPFLIHIILHFRIILCYVVLMD
jgi:hypothetical protein